MRHLPLSVAVPLAFLLALTNLAEARGLDDDNGRGCSPCVPGEPTDSPGTPEDADMWDGRDIPDPDPEPEPDLDNGR